jgi:hypothetical protein
VIAGASAAAPAAAGAVAAGAAVHLTAEVVSGAAPGQALTYAWRFGDVAAALVMVVRSGARDRTVIVQRGDKVQTLRVDPGKQVGGNRVGSVYRRADGRLAYVQGP